MVETDWDMVSYMTTGKPRSKSINQIRFAFRGIRLSNLYFPAHIILKINIKIIWEKLGIKHSTEMKTDIKNQRYRSIFEKSIEDVDLNKTK
jgi:hypothetical protein